MKKTLRVYTTLRGATEKEIFKFLRGNGFNGKFIEHLEAEDVLKIESEFGEAKVVTVIEIEMEAEQ